LQRWTAESTALWEKHDSPGEYNSPTYAGITLMALGLAQYCPKDSAIYRVAPKLIRSVWTSLGKRISETEIATDIQARPIIRLYST